MKNSILVTILIAAAASAACVRSIQPFYEQKDVYFDRSLVGVWSEPDGKETWTVHPREETAFVIDQATDDGRKARYEATLFRIGDMSFIDLVPVPAGDIGQDLFFDHIIPGHTFLALKKDRCETRLSYMDPTWLKTFLMKNPNGVGHSDVGGQIILTDSTKNLQSFIRKHLASPGAFEQTETLYKRGETQCEQKN